MTGQMVNKVSLGFLSVLLIAAFFILTGCDSPSNEPEGAPSQERPGTTKPDAADGDIMTDSKVILKSAIPEGAETYRFEGVVVAKSYSVGPDTPTPNGHLDLDDDDPGTLGIEVPAEIEQALLGKLEVGEKVSLFTFSPAAGAGLYM
ncbi:MAG: hypothetical protein LBL84_00755 [Candidatus Nomurabacteria bacterium]|jgi:hypothetical protein|nr:hypothetical protein [Candidatus Nomurabacteria bacterium]